MAFCWIMFAACLAQSGFSFIHARNLTGPSLAFRSIFYQFAWTGLFFAGVFAFLSRAYIPNRIGEPLSPQQRLKVIRTLPLLAAVPLCICVYSLIVCGFKPLNWALLAVSVLALMAMIGVAAASSRAIRG